MALPSRERIEQIAFMAMMDGIIHTSVPCSCPTCKADNKSRGAQRSQQPKRSATESKENSKPAPKAEASGSCGHNHPIPELKTQPAKKSAPPPTQNKNAPAPNSNPGRSDKVNLLLKAENIQAVFDVFNLTITTKEESLLATKIQGATKNCKLYQETKDKILEVCDNEEDLDALFGLLAKFRYERNMLTTAVIKGNNEREKALLCIQRVDHLMYMLQDVAKKKDSKGNDVMHKLGDIIMEIHDLAKTPSTLYDEFLDIKEEHFDLLNDHEEMHQKFVDVNSCHEKLHSSHDKLQTEHTKVLRDLADAKKKASIVGNLKNDITRLEKAADKAINENTDLKKEVERLNAELAKVNALKHENAQLKKKVTTLSAQAPPVEEPSPQASQAQASKKKKGKKLANEASIPNPPTPEPTSGYENRTDELEKAHEAQITKLKKAHNDVSQELETVRTSLKQLDVLLRKADSAKDRALEKLEVEKATSQNWKDIAKGHSTERNRLQVEMDRHITRASKLQSTVEELEQSLHNTKAELAEQVEVHKQVKEELERRSPTPAMSVASHQTVSLSPDMIQLLRKIRAETGQLARNLDESRSFGGDPISLLDIVHAAVRRVVSEVERDIEEILSVKGNDPPINSHSHIPEAVLPFTYNNLPTRQPNQFSPRSDYSPPQESPRIPSSTSLPPYRPMMPPPGFTEPSTSPFNHSPHYNHSYMHAPNHTRGLDSPGPTAPYSRIAEPPGLTSNLNVNFNRPVEPQLNLPMPPLSRYSNINAPSTSSLHSHSSLHSNSNSAVPNPNVGVIGSRSTNSKLVPNHTNHNANANTNNTTPSPVSTPAPSVGSTSGTAPAGLGNGAVGVDWNMWARSAR